MSKVFYDHLIILEEVESEIKAQAESEDERHELWQIVDEIIHHRLLHLFLDKLPEMHHDEFLHRFHKSPHDENLLGFLNERIEEKVEDLVKEEMELLTSEILREIRKKVIKVEYEDER